MRGYQQYVKVTGGGQHMQIPELLNGDDIPVAR